MMTLFGRALLFWLLFSGGVAVHAMAFAWVRHILPGSMMGALPLLYAVPVVLNGLLVYWLVRPAKGTATTHAALGGLTMGSLSLAAASVLWFLGAGYDPNTFGDGAKWTTYPGLVVSAIAGLVWLCTSTKFSAVDED